MNMKTIAQIPAEGLIAYWPFNGNPSDSSGNGHYGMLHGSILVNDRFMLEDKAYSFNHSNNDYIQTDIYDSVLANYTAVGWFYWNGKDNSHAIGTYLEAGKGWAWKVYNNKVRFYQKNIAFNSTYDIVPMTWFHVSISFDGSVARLYMNGEENSSQPVSGSTGETLVIGAIPKYLSEFNWDGYIDEVLIYDRALSSDEIFNLYSCGVCTQIIYDTLIVYDTILVYDSIIVVDSISVTDTLRIEVNLGIPQPNTFNTIKVYPNPTRNIIHIKTGNYLSMENYSIRIINNLGAVVFWNLCNQQEFTIDIGEFGAKGLFYLQIINAGNQVIDTRKILLE